MLALTLVAALSMGRLDSPVTDRVEKLTQRLYQQAGSPRAAATLIRMHGFIDEVDDLNLLAGPYANLLYRQNTNPYVRSLARVFYADLQRARGRTQSSSELLEPMGFVQDYWVVGGFDNEGKSGCDTDFGPEAGTDLKATYFAKGQAAQGEQLDGEANALTWRKLPARSINGYVDLSSAVRPASQVVVYALTFLQAERETTTELSLGTPGGFRLWINGVKAASEDKYNVPRLDQARYLVHLRKGTNRVLLKLCQDTGPLGFFLRAERAPGASAGVKVVLPDQVPPLEKGSNPMPVALPTLTDAFLKLVKAAPNDAQLHSEYAVVLGWQRGYDEKEHLATVAAQRAAELAPKEAEIQLIAAEFSSDDHDQQRQYLEAALKADPKYPQARLGMAAFELTREHPDRAAPMLEQLVKEYPNFGAARVAYARALEALGERVHAVKVVEEAFALLPLLPQVAREAAQAAHRLDRVQQMEERERMIIGLRFDDLNARRSLAGLLGDEGRIADATDQYRRLLALDPFDLGSRLRLAELLASNGSADAASQVFTEAHAFAPRDPDVYEREGRAQLYAGKKPEAIVSLKKALDLKPQNATLKEVLRTLQGESNRASTRWAFDARALTDEAAKTKLGDEDAVYLTDTVAVRVQASGLSSRFQQQVVKVLNQRGVESFRSLPITYSPDRQEVRVVKARITKPDGSVVESYQDGERPLNEPWTGMYYDARARILSFPALAPGDVLELQWSIDDTSSENLLSDYWGDVDSVQSTYPKLHYRYAVEMPKGRPLYWNQKTLPSWVKTEQKEEDGRTVYLFEAANVAKVIPEPQMPGWAEVSTLLHMSTYQTWEQVGRYWWGLVRDQLVPNEELKKTVDTVLKGVDRKDDRKVISAIYDFVVTHTRYVALEFGIHGFKPYRVDRVLARRFGDCKDKASLIFAMLKVAGVDARLVLLRMRNLGQLDPQPASLAAFNHAIAYVPKYDLYLDGTAEFHGTGEMPGQDRQANVLIVEPDGASRFLVTPEAKADLNTTVVDMTVKLSSNGSADATGSIETRGEGAPEFRRLYQAAATRRQAFEQAWAQSFPALTVSKVDVTDLSKLEEPVKISFEMSTPRYAEYGNVIERFYPFGSSRAYTQVLAPLVERKYDAVFPEAWVNVFKTRYVLPAEYSPDALPPKETVESPFGSFTLECKNDGQLACEGRMELAVARVSAKDYPKFREWLLKVDQLFSRKLIIRKSPTASHSQEPTAPRGG
ncbi:MAG: DUF3857 domain-containing protein [Myxococcaceae bacterium]